MSRNVLLQTRWNAAAYAANSSVQQSWAREIIAKLKLRGDERILDVGCGDGKITAELACAVSEGSVVGVDASPQMIEFARKTFPKSRFPNLEFHVADAREIGAITSNLQNRTSNIEGRSVARSATPPLLDATRNTQHATQFDLVFSNAALHWVDDHQAFLCGAASVLRPGGRLVVSCGGKGNAQDVFVALRPEMRAKRWREFFRNMDKPYFFYSPENYEKWLPRYGFKTRRVKLASKDATYGGREGFATWLRTTWLPYVQRVPDTVPQMHSNLREEFISAVTDRYLAKHPLDSKGLVHVRMVRLEIDAVKV